MKQSLIVGDELDQTTDVPDYPPSDGWTLYYRLVPRETGTPILLTGVSTSDDKHRHYVASSSTANWAAGEYSAFAWVDDGTAKVTIDPETGVPGDSSIVVTLQEDPRTVLTYDGRSPARVALDAMNTALAAFGSSAFSNVKSYTIGNRSMEFREFRDQGDFMAHRSLLKSEVWREDEAARTSAGLPSRRFLQTRLCR